MSEAVALFDPGTGSFLSIKDGALSTTPKSSSIDADACIRVSHKTTLFDGKCLNTDDLDTWENVGTGTGSLANNMFGMTVTTGQYLIRQSRRTIPYFSGNSQKVEITFDNFQTQAGITKRAGFFTSNAVAPYDSTKDGFWLENDGTTIRFVVQNAGTVIINTPLSSFDNYAKMKDYDWSKFTILVFDYLWLGGSEVRLHIKTPDGFTLAHTFEHASLNQGTFIRSPNQCVRYEIRSISGSGFMNAICSKVATEGGTAESGKPISIFNATSLACNVIGTIYALKSVRKTVAQRDVAIEVTNFGVAISAADAGILMLIINPTLSSAITYTNKSRFDEGTPTNQTITPGTGRVVKCIAVGGSGSVDILNDRSFLNYLSASISNVMDEYVIAYMPTTTTQTVTATCNLKEY